jgi:putative ABC transport system substrate-binding protein
MTESGYIGYRWLLSDLRRLGWIEGKNMEVVRLSAEGREARFPELAREAVRRRPDVILVTSSRLVLALKAETMTIPVVGITADPIASGIISNLARPEGNITGFSSTPGDAILGKQLELLREAVPEASRVAFLVPESVWPDGTTSRALREAAARLGVALIGAPLAGPIEESEYRRVFQVMLQEGAQALIVGDTPENIAHHQIIVALAAQARLPAMYHSDRYAKAGGLMSYAFDIRDMVRRAADYIDRILKGARPSALPYQQPTKFELVINLKTAKALGLTIPPSLLARADQVIE